MSGQRRNAQKGATREKHESGAEEDGKVVQLESYEDVRNALKAISGIEGKPMKVVTTRALRAFVRAYGGGFLAHMVPKEKK